MSLARPTAPLTSTMLSRAHLNIIRNGFNSAVSRRAASTRRGQSNPVTDKTRILEKPTRFNPPSHPARRVKPRKIFGPDLSIHGRQEQATKHYPNMMPPVGSFRHWFLTNRPLHLWITLSTLTFLALYTFVVSFVATTTMADQLPTRQDWARHPFQSLGLFFSVYRLHAEQQSAEVAEKRRLKVEDAAKRKEYMRAHGVEPGFLTGSWMEKFGTVDSDGAREAVQEAEAKRKAQGLPEEQEPAREKKKVKMFFGIW